MLDAGGVTHGFLLNGTTETVLNDPNGVFTQALGLNNRGQVVGAYMDGGGAMHGFVYDLSLIPLTMVVFTPLGSLTVVNTPPARFLSSELDRLLKTSVSAEF